MCINLFLNKKGGPGAPLTYFNDGGGGGGGGASDFLGCEILAKSDFFILDYERRLPSIFWGCKKRTKGFF